MNLFHAKALPEPDFKYFSNSKALNLSMRGFINELKCVKLIFGQWKCLFEKALPDPCLRYFQARQSFSSNVSYIKSEARRRYPSTCSGFALAGDVGPADPKSGYLVESCCIFITDVLRWFTSTLSTQEPLKINIANSIPQVSDKGTWVDDFLV